MLDLPFNPDLLPGDQVVSEALLSQIHKHFGSSAKLVATRGLHESIPRPLRAEDVPGSKLPAIHQPMVLGVVAGAESHNLVAIGFPAEEAVASFIAANPALKETLVTKWERYYVLWVQTDFLGANLELPEVLWLCLGVIPIAWLDEEDEGIKVYRAGTPKQMSYHALAWPDGIDGVFRFEFLKSVYGKPYHKRRLNLGLWAAWSLDR